MVRTKLFQTINNPHRNSSVDVFRGIAIICVVLVHFNGTMPFGYLGVDLFFVISGLLIGGLLTRQLKDGKKINFFKFFIQRGFKIWPSYYAFLLFGSVLAFCLYRYTNPDQIIPFWDLKRYLFFYQNYTGQPFHWSFDHVWSLCVEEHFYILLPILFVLIQTFVNDKNKAGVLLTFTLLIIAAGIGFKFCSYYLTHSKDTYSGTHNRIDALAWGVLLNLVISYRGEKLRLLKFSYLISIAGLLILAAAIYLSIRLNGPLFNKIYFHSIVPFSFFLMLLGVYYANFSKLKVIRYIAYYSYNWYLWHPIFVLYIKAHFGVGVPALVLYLAVSFITAVILTTVVEEPFLQRRKAIVDRLFKNQKIKPAIQPVD